MMFTMTLMLTLKRTPDSNSNPQRYTSLLTFGQREARLQAAAVQLPGVRQVAAHRRQQLLVQAEDAVQRALRYVQRRQRCANMQTVSAQPLCGFLAAKQASGYADEHDSSPCPCLR